MPRKSRDLTNQRFGKLTAIRKVNTTGQARWECRCDCGKIKTVRASHLLDGDSKSCGCEKHRPTRELTNQRFGRLVALKRVNATGKARWECQCDCGNRKIISATDLLAEKIKSCGCLKTKDLTNQRFGRLVAIRKVSIKGSTKWLCKCDCGNTKEIPASYLLAGTTNSCGCIQKEKSKDLTNQKFGSWTVLEKVSPNPARWKCRCDCGREREIFARYLLNGHTKSCGKCEYRAMDLTGQRFGRLVVLKITKKRSSYGTHLYECRCDCGNIIYVTAGHLKSGGTKSCGCYIKDLGKDKMKYMHQKAKEKYIDGAYTPFLRSKVKSNNTSGYVGVQYIKKRDRWLATIMLKGKYYYLGTFKRKEDAIKARQRGEEELFEPILEKYAELQRNNNE